MGLFDFISEAAAGAGEALQGGVEGVGEVLDPAQLTESATDVIDQAGSAVENINPFN
jgi:hypothetical protein